MNEATTEELQADIQERLSENPMAYRGNELHYKLTEADIHQTCKGTEKKKKKKN